MTNLRRYVERHPVATYFVLTFTISWGGILLLAALFGTDILANPGGGPDGEGGTGMLYALVLLTWFAGPSLSSLLLTGFLDGKAGLRALRSRLFRWRVDARWYALSLLGAPLLVLAVLLVLTFYSPAFRPGIFLTHDKAALLLFGIAWGLVGGGFLEELGWTGFAVPRLRQNHGVLATALIVGAAWGALHFILVGWGSASMAGEHAAVVYALAILCFYLASLPAYRVLMVRVHDRTGSLLVAMLMHASLSASMIIFQPPATGAAFLTWNFALAAVLWSIVAADAVLRRRRFSPTVARPDAPGLPHHTLRDPRVLPG
jgi:uncharacterized protein